MKRFEKRELREAIDYAMKGGQAFHVHNVIANPGRAPLCFRNALNRGEMIAHLFDQDERRLKTTAKMFGVYKIRIERHGQEGQHIDLCGVPFFNAVLYCEDPDAFRRKFRYKLGKRSENP